ncbi:hypothetical protein HPA02_25070 [Bisbaumannia pacifica]|uniref:Uncharacterized protein n=1 Tax=Bisbaumannia pacifica TaxID=77098 RepID=A0A510X9Z3_9GAMM|nr:hypothetical protein [Halomonas pacifica]GEK48224.1 hypothetical protein HPA02_25070 [Halomonas pacifica]
MNLTRRQLLKNGLVMGAASPVALGTTWADASGASRDGGHGEIRLYGTDRWVTEMGLGLRQQGWGPRYEGRLDPLSLNDLPRGTMAAGFTDDAGLVLLTSLLAGRGRILALGRHMAGADLLESHRGPITRTLSAEEGSWQAALGREYARLALANGTGRHVRRLSRPVAAAEAGALSFLIRL